LARKEKRIGSAQEAAVVVQAAGPEYEFLAGHREDLETICIVSRLTVQRAEGASAGQGLVVRVVRAPGEKCQRCWNYRESVGASPTHPALCDRCVAVLEAA
jgi:isoleucyl-tRNA synthetase